MASSGKLPSASELRRRFRGQRVAVGLSGGIDSVVLLHLLKEHPGIRAVHVHHGLSPNADAWSAFCARLCKAWHVRLTLRRVKVRRKGEGLEAAARSARYAVFARQDCDVVALAHQLDDQAETVLMNLLRGAGLRGASGMLPLAPFEGKLLARPQLDVPRAAIAEYARLRHLEWIEDESNADETLTRNFVRLRLGPLIATRFPQWQRSLARAARLFSERDDRASRVLRDFLQQQGLKAPSEAKLVEMLKQLTSAGARIEVRHDGRILRVYRNQIRVEATAAGRFTALAWEGERRLKIPALGGELRFIRGDGIASSHLKDGGFQVRLRSGGERLQLHPRRPRRTLKNLFQEAGVPSWERERMPLLFRGNELVWVPGLGVDVRYRGPGLVPRWVASAA